jgi:hypothetical protein
MSVPTTTLLKQLAGEVEWLQCMSANLQGFPEYIRKKLVGLEEDFGPMETFGEGGGLIVPWEFIKEDEIYDHAEAALDIIEELEGREARAGWQEPLFHTAMNENTRRILESRAVRADLRRLHDLIKGSAGREAMDLIRRMMGEEGKDE